MFTKQTNKLGGAILLFHKFLLVMRLTTAILIATFMQVSAASLAQTFTFKKEKSTYKEVFTEIKKQLGYNVVWSADVFDAKKKIDVAFKEVSITTVLEQTLLGTNISYSIKNKTVVLKKEEEKSLLERTVDRFAAMDVKGRVVDKEGRPVVGANVQVKGTSKVVRTDERGDFEMKGVLENAVLVISFVGYESREIDARQNLSSIVLMPSLSKLDEVQVIAYGTTSRRLSTGNISTVKAEDIEKQPVSNPLLALQGRVPGLVVTQNSGMAGGAITVRIQGQNSIKSGNDPLYVIDGIPIVSQLLRTGNDAVLGSPSSTTTSNLSTIIGNPLNYLNPSDIESIDVLKDADATSIFGSRAANGAIIITTKKGKPGKTKLDFNFQTGTGEITRNLSVLNTRQYLDMRYEAYKNDNIDWRNSSITADDLKVWDTTRITNWQKELIGNVGTYHIISSSISGGTENLQYRISGAYNRQTTVFPNISDFADQKGSLSFNLSTISSNKKLKIQFSNNYMVDDNVLPQIDLTQKAIFLEPLAPSSFNSDGTLNWALNSAGNATNTQNPYINLFRIYENNTTNLLSNLKLTYDILTGLSFVSNVGYNNLRTADFSATPTATIAPNLRSTNPNNAGYGTRNISSYTIEPQLHYLKGFTNLSLDFLLGGTYLVNKSNLTNLIGQTYASDEILRNIQAASVITTLSSDLSQYKYVAAFSRLNLVYKHTYILNLTARRDGSSRFGSNKQFNNFGSIGAAWLFSNEDLIKNSIPFISFGKLRASFGTTGNDQIGDYLFQSLYNPVNFQVPYQGGTALSAAGLPNPNLEWEETKKLQFGLDMGIARNRIQLNINYFSNSSSNQLLNYNYSSVAGRSSIITNLPALVRNSGWELSFNGDILKKRGIWNTGFNITIPKNRLIKYPGIETSSFANLLKIGEPINVIRSSKLLGVNQAIGLYQFANSAGDPVPTVLSNVDNNIWINMLPQFYGGWQNSISYRGLQIDFLVQFTKQIGLGNAFGFATGAATPGAFSRGASNQPVIVLNRWQKPGDNTRIQRLSSANFNAGALLASGNAYEDASFARLKNVSISWGIPQKWINPLGLQNFRIYLQGQNLLTYTKYTGLDPETRNNSSLPPLRILVLGMKLDL